MSTGISALSREFTAALTEVLAECEWTRTSRPTCTGTRDRQEAPEYNEHEYFLAVGDRIRTVGSPTKGLAVARMRRPERSQNVRALDTLCRLDDDAPGKAWAPP